MQFAGPGSVTRDRSLPGPERRPGEQEHFTMAVPRKKTSRMKRGFRRSADALTAPAYVEDKESGNLRRPHHIDLKSGKYRKRQVLEIKSDTVNE